jgi:1-deoxy-D-xylulose-5-phosphate synthase
MAIAPNVGAVSRYLNKVISDPTYNKIRSDIYHFTKKLPAGDKLLQLVGNLQDSAKHVLLPGRLFEDLGVRYFGPIDGHDIESLKQIFDRVKDMKGPCLVHILTEKGRGWKPSEEDSYKWHASNPFDQKSMKPKGKSSGLPSFTQVFGETVLELAKKDSKLIGITGAMPSGCGLDIVAKKLPKQVVDVGIAEGHAVTYAAGLACGGMKPIVAIYSTFLQRAVDSVVHDVALQKLPVIFALDRAGLVGADGPTHHGSFDLSYLGMVPDLVIMAPSDQDELRDMLKTAYDYDKGPSAIRYPRGSALAAPKSEMKALEIGTARVAEPGSGVLLLGIGVMFHEMKAAWEILKDEGVDCTLVDARFAKPLNEAQYKEFFENHHTVVTAEDNVVAGGYGTMVSELMNRQGFFGKKVLNIGHPDVFVPHGSVPSLFRKMEMDGESIARRVKQLVQGVRS